MYMVSLQQKKPKNSINNQKTKDYEKHEKNNAHSFCSIDDDSHAPAGGGKRENKGTGGETRQETAEKASNVTQAFLL